MAFLVSRTDFPFLRRVRQEGAVARNMVTRSKLFEFALISFSSASANVGSDGPSILIDFGRMLEDLAESRKPKITVTNRAMPIATGQFVLSVPVSSFAISQQDRDLLVEILRESREL